MSKLDDLIAKENAIYARQPKPLSKRLRGNLAAMSAHQEARRKWREEYKAAIDATERERDRQNQEAR